MVIFGLSDDFLTALFLLNSYQHDILGISRNPGIPYEKGSPVRDVPAGGTTNNNHLVDWLTEP